MRGHAVDGGPDTELLETLRLLKVKVDEFALRWVVPLITVPDLVAAAGTVQKMHTYAEELQDRWRVQVDLAPSANVVREALGRGEARDVQELVLRIDQVALCGIEFLGYLLPASQAALHVKTELGTHDSTNWRIKPVGPAMDAAAEAFLSIEGRVTRDVDAQRALTELLSVYSESQVTLQVQKLNRLVLFLTVFAIIVALAQLIAGLV